MEAIEIPKRIFTITGHWPNVSPSIFQRTLQLLDVLFIFSLLVEFTNHFDDYRVLSEHLAVAASATSYLIKLSIFKWKSNDVQELISLLNLKEFNDYPKQLRPIFERTIKVSKYTGHAYQSTCFISIVLYSLVPFFIRTDLLFKFSYDIGKFIPAVYAFQVIGMVSATVNNSTLDVLGINLIGFCNAQIQILNRKITGLSDWNENEGNLLHSVNADLCECVKHHVEIIRYRDNLEKVFSMIIFAQYGTSAIGICNGGFQLVHANPTSIQFISMIVYFIVLMSQLAMYCWFGNELIVQSLGIKDACYDFKWFEADIKTRKTLNIIMERSKIPLTLTAGKVSILSLESYASVMNTSYSYFALMQTMYGKN